MSDTSLPALVRMLRESRGFAHKRDIADAVGALAAGSRGVIGEGAAVANGDDCAAIAQPDALGGGHLLLAIEGLVEDFIERMPWFAGWCSVMVNVSDIHAMGGRPIAVVDAIWSRGLDPAAEVLAGMAAASAAYGVPVVGGHSNHRSTRGQLAVAILGRASRLLTSFDARPGDLLLMAADLRGGWQEPFPYWNAATEAPPARLRGDLELLPRLAEDGLCDAAKDISMAGIAGTALMLLECSGAGGEIDLDMIPRPPGVALARWLVAFPSYGFLLSVRPERADAVRERFAARGLACAPIGRVEPGSCLWLRQGGERALLWDHAEEAFILPRRDAVDGAGMPDAAAASVASPVVSPPVARPGAAASVADTAAIAGARTFDTAVRHG